jgi:nucleotide-binding universal stress UspA family protein
MSIVCGTDFSEHSLRAARVAALLCARRKTALHLVHAIELSSEEVFAEPQAGLRSWAERQLQTAADQLAPLGAEIRVHLELGSADERLQHVAAHVGAKLIAVAALGQRTPGKWALGSNAERLAHRSQLPVLVVRQGDALEAWARGERPLRVVLGIDRSLSSDAAMRWTAELRAYGPCEVTAVHLYWPPEQFHRFGLSGVRSYVEPDPEVTKALTRDFSARLENALRGPATTLLEPHIGRIGDRLAIIADEHGADLVVVGTHGRGPQQRLLYGSVSHDAVHWAKASVACVPAPPFTHALAAPRLATVLVATDFSPAGNAAIPLAYGIVADGGTVHMVHVVKERGHHPADPHDIFPPASADSDAAHADVRRQLFELIPHDVEGQTRTSLLHVLESNDPARAICQAAERLDARAICLGTHARTGLAKVVLGSVAQSVLEGTSRPVLLARRPPE